MAHRAYLVIDGPGHNRTHVPLRDGITSLGRLPSNDVILQGDLVSRHHARILFFDGRASLQDLGSHNGCWVNGEKITTCPMNEGDTIRVGNFQVEFFLGEPDLGPALDEETSDQAATPADGMPRAPRVISEALPDGVDCRDPTRSHLWRVVDEVASAPELGDSTPMLLFRVAEALTRARDAAGYLEAALQVIAASARAGVAAIYRTDGAGLRVAAATHPAETLATAVSQGVLRWAVQKNYTVFSRDLKADHRFAGGRSVLGLGEEVSAQVCAPLSHDGRVLGALYVSRSVAAPFAEAEVEILEAVAHLLATGVTHFEGRAGELARHYPPDTIEALARRGGAKVETQTATVLWAEVQGFAKLADRLAPERLGELLEAFRLRVGEVLFKHGAALRFGLGADALAVFGPGTASGGHDADRATQAAIAVRSSFDGMAASFRDLGPRRVRAGIATGPVMSGLVGGAAPDFAAVGEAVDTARLLLEQAPPGAVMVDAETEALARGRFLTEEAGSLAVRGRREPVPYFQVLGTR